MTIASELGPLFKTAYRSFYQGINDDITRRELKILLDAALMPYAADLAEQRVVCDVTNNTQDVIESNDLHATVDIKLITGEYYRWDLDNSWFAS
jgi:hypothetical protein